PTRNYTVTHIACANHQVILAQGAWVETMFPGPETLRRLSPEDHDRLANALGKDVMDQATARPCVTRNEARLLLPPLDTAEPQFEALPLLRSA
ncbi:MAG: hypothetical protein AAGA94_17555, partial [Pseudomonadota bacterium]